MADPIVDAILSNQQNRDFWQGTLRNLVQTIAQIPQMRQQAEERQALAQERYAQAQDRMAVLQERQQKAADLQALDQAFRQPGGREQILSRVPGHLQPAVLKHFADVDKSNLEYQTALGKAKQVQQDNIARVLFGVRDIGEYSPEAAQTAISTIKASYPDDQQLQGYLGQVEQQLHQNPTPAFVKKFVDSALMQSEEARKALEAQQKTEKGALDITAATQKTTGTEPIQPAQQARLDAQAASEARAEAAQRSTEAYQQTMAKAAMIRANKPTAAQAAAPPVEIKAGTPEYKVAQDLASGKLTMQQFRSLTAYSRDTGKKMGIYNLASQFNPEFNPAQFELGFKMASNPQIRNRIVAINALGPVIDQVDALADQVGNGDIPAWNRLLNTAKFNVGNRQVSNFRQMQTLLGEEVGNALGVGTGSDLKTRLGLDLVNPNLSAANFRATMQQLRTVLESRRAELYKQMGIYGDQAQAGGSAPAPAVKPVGRYNPATGKVEPIKE